MTKHGSRFVREYLNQAARVAAHWITQVQTEADPVGGRLDYDLARRTANRLRIAIGDSCELLERAPMLAGA